tara:strand:+ start:473 stop:1411 length:939 start_codon:yes stop_codon:yes gene_type:complete
MKIFLLGSSGFIGNNLTDFLAKETNYSLTCFGTKSNNLLLYRNVDWIKNRLPSKIFEKKIKEYKPNFVLFCCGTSSVTDSVIEPSKDFKGSVILLEYVLETIRKFSLDSKLLFFSSAAVYGSPKFYEKLSEESPKNPISPYGFNRLFCENLLAQYRSLYSLQSVSLRIFSAYGDELQTRIFWDFAESIRKDNKIKVKCPPNVTRDFIHITDLCKAVKLIIDNYKFDGLSHSINIASGESTSIKKVTSIFKNNPFYDEDLEIEFSKNFRKGDPINWEADISKLEKLSFKTSVSIEEGLSSYISWYKKRFINQL